MRGERVPRGWKVKGVEREDGRGTITLRIRTPPTQPSSSTYSVHCAENFGIVQARSIGKYIDVAVYFQVPIMYFSNSCNVPLHTPYGSAAVAYKVGASQLHAPQSPLGSLRALSVR